MPTSPPSHSLLVFLFLVPLLLAGCSDPRASSVSESYPTTLKVGDAATYHAEDGTQLKVNVVGYAKTRDPWLREVDAVVLRYRLQPGAPGWEEYTFLEYLDGSARIIQQSAACATPLHPQDNRGACFDDRVAAYFGAWGLPGGLGMGNIWVTERVVANITVPPIGPLARGPIASEWLSSDDCVTVEQTSPALPPTMLPFTLTTGTSTVCGGQPFPSSFQGTLQWNKGIVAEGNPQFTLVGFQPGTEPVRWPTVAPPAETSSLATRTFQTPLYLDPPPDDLPFATATAVQVARNQSDRVSSFLAEHPKAVPITSAYTETGYGDGGEIVGGSYVEDERTLYLADGTGPCLRIHVTRSHQQASNIPLDSDSTTYSVTDVSACGSFVANLPLIERTQVSVEAVVEWGRQLTGLEASPTSVGYSHKVRSTGWTHPYDWFHPHGYEVVTTFKDPHPRQMGTISFSVVYELRVDGASGAINMVTAPNSLAERIT